MDKLLSSLGSVCAVIGAQWGDEGKGKIIDVLAEHFDVIARACGGANAGHTIVVNGKKHVFRLMPSGCLHGGKPVILGGGMAIHLPTLFEEIDIVNAAGIDILPRLHIAANAHIVFDYHKEIDGVLEERRIKEKGEGIGTTKRGIGPAYMDKAARSGMRMDSVRSTNEEWRRELEQRARSVQELYGVRVNVHQECAALEKAKQLLLPSIENTLVELFANWRSSGKKLLIEGAQATLLDIDHGTYPFVTSSATTAAGALQGLGLAPKCLDSCIGVAKAYCTRVGSGSFPSEADPETAQRLRTRGGEFCSVTGRPRRCGWIFLPDLRYCALLNGFDCWYITKLDVLDEEEEIPVGVALDSSGMVIYKRLKGWKTSTQGITEFAKLPKQARDFLAFVEKETGTKIALIGTGQGREEIIVR